MAAAGVRRRMDGSADPWCVLGEYSCKDLRDERRCQTLGRRRRLAIVGQRRLKMRHHRSGTGVHLRVGDSHRGRNIGEAHPQFDLGRELHRISGVDLTRIDGIDVGVAQTVISEVGLDMSRWQDEHHFASWLGLCPDNRITGGKVIRRGTRHVINRAATALRIAATTLLRSQSYLGAQFRRLRGKLGAPKAITAMAHKLAVLVYRMLRWGREYVDKGMQYYEERHREQQIRLLKKRAAKLGLVVV